MTTQLWQEYELLLDLDRDRTYDNANDDITDRLIAFSTRAGMYSALDTIPSPGHMQLTLRDNDAAFVNGGTYADLKLGTLVRLRMRRAGGTWYQLFEGKIADFRTTWDENRFPVVQVLVTDPVGDLYSAKGTIKLLKNATVDACIESLLQNHFLPWPYGSSYFIIGQSLIGGSAVIYGLNSSFYDFETAKTTVPYFGPLTFEATEESNGIQQALLGLTISEAEGRFFWDTRSSQWMFHNRHHDALASATYTFADSEYTQVDPVGRGDMFNQVNVNYYRRVEGTAGGIVWSEENPPIRVNGGDEKKITCRYFLSADEDIKLAVLGGLTVDATVTDDEEGLGNSLATGWSISIEQEPRLARLTLTNNRGGEIYFQSLVLRSIAAPILTYPKDSVLCVDAESGIENEFRNAGQLGGARDVDAIYMTEEVDAERYGNWLVGQYSQPIERIDRMVFGLLGYLPTTADKVLDTCIGDCITTTNTRTGHDTDYIVVGEEHRWSAGIHNVVWVVRPRARKNYFIIGSSLIGGTDVIAL